MVNYFKKNRQMKEKRKIEPPDIPSPKKEKENHEFILKGRMNGRMNRYHLFPTNRQNV